MFLLRWNELCYTLETKKSALWFSLYSSCLHANLLKSIQIKHDLVFFHMVMPMVAGVSALVQA